MMYTYLLIYLHQVSILSNTSATFRLTLIASVPHFMSLNIDIALVMSPTENELIINNANVDFIKDYYISEDSDSYISSSDCLLLAKMGY